MAKNIKRIVLTPPPEKCYNELNDYDTCIGERVYKVNNTIRDYVANHFEEALQSGCITVCYEPVLRALTNKICSFEALARWHDPERGEILPRDFIPVLEETNKIHLLDHFIAKTAIQALHTRQQQDLPIVPVVINLSRRDFCLSALLRHPEHQRAHRQDRQRSRLASLQSRDGPDREMRLRAR